MALKNYLGHDMDGQGPGGRLREVGYESAGWAENIAAGQQGAGEAVQSWMSSSGHRANILNPTYTEIGIGITTSAAGAAYYTQVFGISVSR